MKADTGFSYKADTGFSYEDKCCQPEGNSVIYRCSFVWLIPDNCYLANQQICGFLSIRYKWRNFYNLVVVKHPPGQSLLWIRPSWNGCSFAWLVSFFLDNHFPFCGLHHSYSQLQQFSLFQAGLLSAYILNKEPTHMKEGAERWLYMFEFPYFRLPHAKNSSNGLLLTRNKSIHLRINKFIGSWKFGWHFSFSSKLDKVPAFGTGDAIALGLCFEHLIA